MSITTERHDPPVTSAPPAGDRFVGGTLLALAVILTVYQLIARHVIPPLAVFALLFTLGGVLVWRRRRRWTLIVAGALVLLYLGGSIRFFAANLAHPESPVSFLAEVFLLVGLVTAIVGVVMGLRGARPGQRRPVAYGALAVSGVAVVVSVIATVSVDSDARQDDDVAVEVIRSRYPDTVDVSTGASVLWFDNQDPFHHTVVIDGTDVREVLAASTAVRIPVDLEPGDYRYWCDVPGHESMEGELRVR